MSSLDDNKHLNNNGINNLIGFIENITNWRERSHIAKPLCFSTASELNI